MATIAVLGAGGQTGRLLLDELRAGGHRVVALTSDASRVGRPPDTRTIELRATADAAAVADALADVELLVDTAGPYRPRGDVALEAALAAGVHYLDACLEPTFSAWVHDQGDRARRAGVVVVTAGGFPAAVLDLLALSALAAADGGRQLHVATTLLDRGWLRGASGPATREVVADLLEGPTTALVDGALTREPIGEARRLAWFPRPVGLAHAAAVPGTAVLSIHRRDAGVVTAREYLAMAGWRAELLQLAATITRWAPARRRLRAAVEGRGAAPSAERRRRVRWACVAETRGEQGTVRAWANGRDPAATSAAVLAELATAVLAHGEPGVRTPGELAAPGVLLDALSATREVRWAVIRP